MTDAAPIDIAPTAPSPPPPPLLRVSGLAKRYGGIEALRGVDLEVRPGEVHALMGENGAGKSTLAKILAGVQQADAGNVLWRGEPVAFKSTAEARAAGVAIVLQELNLVPDLSVAENIYLTHASAYAGRLWQRKGEIRRRTRELADRFGWGGLIHPDRIVRDLSVAEQQMAEILRALSWDAELYILDEPTATLSSNEVDLLFRTIRELRDRGVAFLLVTHRLEEVFALADRITVYRDGANSGAFTTGETTEADLIRAMVGRDLGDVFGIRARGAAGEPVLQVAGLTRGDRVRGCSLTVRRGEVVGVAGLVGAGRTELIRAVFGADRASGGTVTLSGSAGLVRSPREGIARRAGMVPEDRKAHGLMIDLPIAQNIGLASITREGGFWLRPRAERALVQDMRQRLQIRAPDTAKPAGSLSGGNQQKVVLAKWLATKPDLLILDEPTRGIDVGTKHEIYRLIDGLAAAGTAILLVSSELPEILALSDRILVMRDGALVAELDGATATEEAILGHAA